MDAMSSDREARTVLLNEAITGLLEYERAEALMKTIHTGPNGIFPPPLFFSGEFERDI